MKSIIYSKINKWDIKEKNFSEDLERLMQNNPKKQTKGWVFIFTDNPSTLKESAKKTHDLIDKLSLPWQKENLLKSNQDNYYFQTDKGPVWILKNRHSKTNHDNFFSESKYTWSRENVGSLMSHFKIHKLDEVYVYFGERNEDLLLGSLVGLDLALYNYKNTSNDKKENLPDLFLSYYDKKLIVEAENRSSSINLARHLVNMPPNLLGPKDLVKLVRGFDWKKNVKVQVWDQEKLKKEKMNLHLAVGQGAEQEPQLLRINYTHPKNRKTIAFVGKGITFDTGGLDLKPSSAMRLMKKDMGGAACLLGLARYINNYEWPVNIEIFLALAENSVDGKSFRPSDVIVSRSGQSVEIDNTDAEGRLVLADALDFVTREIKELDSVINVATLTGAIKVALGAEIAGLFSNSDELSVQLLKSSQQSGDLCWRMPLVEKYAASLSSSFADFKNSSEGFGGAITAALFLQKFINNKNWAHLDIYAWNDKPTGSLSMSGGNGQGVQLLIEYLQHLQLR
ncbi:MAG: leucyl aminopeptidase family protein [Bdellovibrionaceae bacterium]|nr:leucyl aminopeptidase family protein [Pseudobdellovibrionaceae bacterium]